MYFIKKYININIYMQVDYHAKYLKYKQKYLDLKEEMMGGKPTYVLPKNPNNELYDVLPEFKSSQSLNIGCSQLTTFKSPETGASMTGTPNAICNDKTIKLPWVKKILEKEEVKKMCKTCK